MNETDQIAPGTTDNAEQNGWSPGLNLPCQMTFGLSIPNFTLGDLLKLKVGTVIDTGRPEGTDVGVLLNGQLIGWAEFEASGRLMSFRLTELSE